MQQFFSIFSIFFQALAALSPFAWLTHLFRCFTEDQWGFLIAGALLFPVAIIHGFGIWFGIW